MKAGDVDGVAFPSGHARQHVADAAEFDEARRDPSFQFGAFVDVQVLGPQCLEDRKRGGVVELALEPNRLVIPRRPAVLGVQPRQVRGICERLVGLVDLHALEMGVGDAEPGLDFRGVGDVGDF